MMNKRKAVGREGGRPLSDDTPAFAVTECRILDVTPCDGGDGAYVTVENTAGEKKRVAVSAATLYEMKLSGKASLSAEETETLFEAALLYRAVKKAMDLLTFGDHTKRGMADKLMARGYPRRYAEGAAAHLESVHMIDEGRFAESFALSQYKALYGRRRIAEKLREKGFETKHIASALAFLDENADYHDNLVRLVIKKHLLDALFPSPPPEDLDRKELWAYREEAKKTRDRAVAALTRCGYSFDDIRSLSREDFEE